MAGAAAYYAVRQGRVPGIYTSWAEASAQVLRTVGAQHKKFKTRAEAEAWMLAAHAQPPDRSHAQSPIRAQPRATGHVRPHATLKRRPRAMGTTTLPVPPNATVVYCDGSCLDNGAPGARAGIGIYFGPGDARNVSARLNPQLYKQTNQVAELVAAIRALALVPPHVPVVVRTDSMYTVQSVNTWRHAWKRAEWRVQNVNKDVQRQLSDAVDARTALTLFQHVKGHAGHVGNEAADKLADAGALLE